MDSSRNGCPAEIRGEEGVLILNPENADQILNSTKIQKEAVVSQPTAFDSISRDINIADEWKGKPAILANISSAADARRALASAAEGVGLFRSEALYLGSDHAPSEAEQYQVYAEIAGLMKNRPVVIRTMDLGADKQPGWAAGAAGGESCTGSPRDPPESAPSGTVSDTAVCAAARFLRG